MTTADAGAVPPPPQEPPGSRTVPIVIGSILAVIGALLALVGGAGLALFGSDGALETQREEVSTPTSALVSGVATIRDTSEAAEILGNPTIRVSARAADGEPGTFVGFGPAREVDRYLEGAAIDRITDFEVDPFRLGRDRREGGGQPEPPADQTFWEARSVDGALDWKVRDGDYRLVVMNADASRSVTTNATFAIDLPGLPGLTIALLVVGLLALSGGLALVIYGARRR